MSPALTIPANIQAATTDVVFALIPAGTVHSGTDKPAGICQPHSSQRLYVAARFLNNVRVRCKPGCEDSFIAVTEQWVNPDGMFDAYWAKTGERSYCFVGLWESEEKLVAARPLMIEHLNAVRDFLEELSTDLGVTDPVSGPVVTHKP